MRKVEGTEHFRGEIIRDINVGDSALTLTFDDGTLELWDDAQACCERRYMTCDDDLSYYRGLVFVDAEVRDASHESYDYGVHEVQFLVVNTVIASFTVANHNEHNGYYGGFDAKACVTTLGDRRRAEEAKAREEREKAQRAVEKRAAQRMRGQLQLLQEYRLPGMWRRVI